MSMRSSKREQEHACRYKHSYGKSTQNMLSQKLENSEHADSV